MATLLEQALEKVGALPPDEQDAIASQILATLASRATREFWRLYESLPADVSKEAGRAFRTFQSDAPYPRLQFKKLVGGPSGTGIASLGSGSTATQTTIG